MTELVGVEEFDYYESNEKCNDCIRQLAIKSESYEYLK